MVDPDNIQKLLDPTKKTNKSEASMIFPGPEHSDLKDVQAINHAFLTFLASPGGDSLRDRLPAGLQAAMQALSGRQMERLATVPFLLLSQHELDDGYWSQTTRGRPIRDLFTPNHDVADPLCRITTAATGFLWQLARRNLYAARVISGATLAWCEQLAEQSLIAVLERAVIDANAVLPRLADDAVFWHRLLGAGVSSASDIRRAAHLSALQTVLTVVAVAPAQRFRTAACYTAVPSLELHQQAKSRDDG